MYWWCHHLRLWHFHRYESYQLPLMRTSLGTHCLAHLLRLRAPLKGEEDSVRDDNTWELLTWDWLVYRRTSFRREQRKNWRVSCFGWCFVRCGWCQGDILRNHGGAIVLVVWTSQWTWWFLRQRCHPRRRQWDWWLCERICWCFQRFTAALLRLWTSSL